MFKNVVEGYSKIVKTNIKNDSQGNLLEYVKTKKDDDIIEIEKMMKDIDEIKKAIEN
jgi:hypothetical protein